MSESNRVLVIAEHDNQVLKTATFNTVTAATQLSNTLDILVIGYNCSTVVKTAAQVVGVSKVIHVDAMYYEKAIVEELTPLIVAIAADYDYVLAAATTFGKNLLPRIAASLDVAQISDVIEIQSSGTFVRPIYAGNALATVQSNDLKKVLTIRTTAFDKADLGLNDAASITPVETKEAHAEIGQSRFVSTEVTVSTRPELTSADIVVAGGRGLGSAENFKMIETLADKLGAAIGASRAAVDAGFVSNDYQVGQTGKIVAPQLYIAIGISGAIQHLAGMKDSKVIVAINKDEEAPIMQIADYALVADLLDAVPQLIDALSA